MLMSTGSAASNDCLSCPAAGVYISLLQEAEGTFMVAFSSADVAVEWCLMVQQVLRDMSWPAR